MKKKLQELPVHIRPCEMRDLPDLRKISALTWGGTDYLSDIAEQWLHDEGFIVAEAEGRVVGVGKLTLLPDGVAWAEGLRTHPEVQGRGVARKVHDALLQMVREGYRDGRYRAVEFATYYVNHISIGFGRKDGFELVENAYVLSRSLTKRVAAPEPIPFTEVGTEHLGPYLLCGWKAVHHCPEGIAWMETHAHAYRIGNTRFYIGGINGMESVAVFPQFSEDALLEAMPALNQLFHGQGEIEIAIPGRSPEWIPILRRHRFHFWDRNQMPCMNLYSFKGDLSRFGLV